MDKPTKEDVIEDIAQMVKAWGLEPKQFPPPTVVPREDGRGWDITIPVPELREEVIEFDINDLAEKCECE